MFGILYIQECGCVAYYMPRDANSMPICSPEKIKCVKESVAHVEQTAFDTIGSVGAECACLPGLQDISKSFL